MFTTIYERAAHWVNVYGLRLLVALLVLITGELIIYVIRWWLHRRLQRHTDSTLRPFLSGLGAVILQVCLFLIVIQLLGIRMTIFAAVIGAFGVAAGLALSGTLQNFTSGILILLLKPYTAGDFIMAQGQSGTVQSVQLFYTIVNTPDNRSVIIPNSKLSNEVIINNNRQLKRRIDLELKLSYQYSLTSLKNMILPAVNSMHNTLEDPAPEIYTSTLEPDGWKLLLSVWVDDEDYLQMKYLLNEKILESLKSNGVKLPGM
ncbi:mechanosensitive ion channel family protein [Chitinophaga solisilvae]|uniref:mechanosensitive ion channel family protein n=1 Tax=Chitinophaga solisilvae TaxID=1233460 RepID=UPI0013693C10|nr:mechanosensitive ion channel family protein [Chitinophaga solisilvae]